YHELDREGRLVKVNLTELRLLGYTAEEMEGRFASDFIEEKISQSAVAAKLAGSGALHPFERTLICKDGTRIPVLVQDHLIYDKDGRIDGIRSTLHDIRERKLLEVALE